MFAGAAVTLVDAAIARGHDAPVTASAVGAALAGCVALAGAVMALDLLVFGSLVSDFLQPAYALMSPGTSALFVVAGLALLRRHRAAGQGGAAPWLGAAAAALLGVACLWALARSGGWNGAAMGLEAAGSVMAVSTVSLFALAGLAMLGLMRRTAAPPLLHASLTTAGLALAGVGVIGAAFDPADFYATAFFAGMAPVTALCFLGLFAAIMLARPDDGWVALLLRRDDLGQRTRLLTAAAAAAPALLAAGLLEVTDQGLLAADLRLSLMTVLITLGFAGCVLRAATLEDAARREREAAAAALRTALAEREVLLGEVYHRVKNNLQQVNAMLMLESIAAPDPAAQAVFQQTADRVRAMGAVHEMLMTSPTITSVDAAHFLRRLCDALRDGLGLTARGLSLSLRADPGALDIDDATAMALVVNELVGNAVKHGFADGRAGAISVRYAREGATQRLTVADDGAGLPSGADGGKAADTGLGSTILRALVQQLRGAMTVDTDGRGVTVTVTAPIKQDR